MTAVFLKLVNMSIAASWLVLAVLLARPFLRKSPKWISCLLWGIVAVRLVIPFFVESPLSLIPSAEVIPQNIATSSAPAIHTGINLVNSTVNPMMTQRVIESGNVWEQVLTVASVVWIVGMAVILLYGMVSYLILRLRVRICMKLQDNVYICDEVASPFILGFFRPKIYLPSGLNPEDMGYVLAHENIHIRRRDHWWKPLGHCLLAVYWFNPLLWVSYILLCRDIEQSCDEKVISQMTNADKQGYSQALVSCSTHRRMIMVCPVAFGEQGVKTRIKAIVSYKKPTFWIVLASVVLCGVISVCFLTNPETCIHIYKEEVITQPSCTQMGVTSHTCRLCQYSYTEPVSMLAHTYGEGVVLQQPTCTAEGSKETECTVCGIKQTVVLEKTAHTDGPLTVLREPTCVASGAAAASCTQCGAEYTVVLSASADAHDYRETVLRESTCTENGEGTKTCTLCSHTEAVTYELAEHTLIQGVSHPGSCSYRGYNAWYCAACGYNHIVYLDYGDHSWWEYIPGCYHCFHCDAFKTDSSGKDSGYSLLDGVVGDEPKTPDELWPVIQIFP